MAALENGFPGATCARRGTYRDGRERKPHLDAVDVRLDVAGPVQIQDVHGPEQWTALGKRYGSDTIQDLHARRPPPRTLRLSVPVDGLQAVKRAKHR